jgi:hypothetical protein
MKNSPDRCNQLRKLHIRLTNEIKVLQGNVQQAEDEGVGPSIESLSTIKTLQATLNTVALQLQQCPPELLNAAKDAETPVSEVAASSLVRQVKSSLPAQRVRQWFPDSEQHDDDDME